MKSQKRFLLYLIVLVIVFILFLSINAYKNDNNSNDFRKSNQNHTIYSENKEINSNSWVLSNRIVIDDSDPSCNWSKTATDNEWCRGNGTWGDPYIIENVIIYSGSSMTWDGLIHIFNSDACFKIQNCEFYDTPFFGSSIQLENTNNGFLINNTCSNDYGHGITLRNSDNNTISGNILNNNDLNAIDVYDSNDNKFIANRANNNDNAGIEFFLSDNNQVSNNTLTDNGRGIIADSSNYNDFFYNDIIGNSGGIYLDDCVYCNITENIIDDCTYKSISLTSLCLDNTIIGNQFNDDTVNAWADGQRNLFNNSLRGNYWRDYTGRDADDNGIGDTPYVILGSANSKDYLPKWDDNIETPPRFIIEPMNFSMIEGDSSKNIKWTAIDINSDYDSFWILRNDTFIINDTWDGSQIVYDELYSLKPNIYNFTCYVNDSLGFQNSSTVFITVLNDIYSPNITIISPTFYDLFGNLTIDFELNIEEMNLNCTWYSLNGGANYTFTGTSGTIEQDAWDKCGNGTIIIRFYANDTLGNMDYEEVTVRKNTHFPNITIISPSPNFLYGNLTINFELNIEEMNLNCTWYSLNGGANYPFTGFSGTIEQDAWDSCGNGTVTIRFYANNTAGNIAYEERIVHKDIIGPGITIISPLPNQLFGNLTIDFELSITDPKLNSTWYSLNGGANYNFTGMSGTINQTAWESCGNGTVTIRFYANDTLGNIAFMDVIVHKDMIPPNITIISPTPYDLFGNLTIDFALTVEEPNLNTTWYSLNGGANYTFTGSSGTIEQDAWDKCGNGTVTIRFYANDTLGNIAFMDINVYKDIIPPNITIISPIPYDLFGNLTIDFALTVEEPNLNTTWYSLNGGANYTFTGSSGTIEQDAWDKCGNGTVIIRFYANDTSGNIDYEEVIVRKNTHFPNITIISPSPNFLYGNLSIGFELTIDEPNLKFTWYSLNGGANYTFTGLSGTINQTAWDSCGNGTVTIRFYANNTAGNIAYEEVIVHKDIIGPDITIISPLPNQLFGNLTIDFELSITDPKLNSTWYSLNGGANYNFTGMSGTINQTAWESCGNGTVTIRFYANDTLGNLAFKDVIVHKDMIPPNITIITPSLYDIFGNLTIKYELIFEESNLNTTWYSLNGGTNYEFSYRIGTIEQEAWDKCGNGTVTIRFYANDTSGNTAFKDIIVYKDFSILSPRIAYALIIGVEDYPDTNNDLSYCRDDAEAIYSFLIDQCNFKPENIILLLDSNATDSAIDNAFSELNSKIGTEDLFLFYFSGHGGGDAFGEYICPYDSIPYNPARCYHDFVLDYRLDALDASQKYVLIDACYSGGMIPESQSSGRYLLTSCRDNELCLEWDSLMHGIFTYFYLISLDNSIDLNGDNVISIWDQSIYVYNNVISFSTSCGYTYHPDVYNGITGEGVLYPAYGLLSLSPSGNNLDYSFYLYGTGQLNSINITICSVTGDIILKSYNLKGIAGTYTGFGYYSGSVQLNGGETITGYEILAEIEGNNILTLKNTYGDYDGDELFDIFEISILGTDPRLKDTDGDGYDDGWEYLNGYNPLDPNDPPKKDGDDDDDNDDDDTEFSYDNLTLITIIIILGVCVLSIIGTIVLVKKRMSKKAINKQSIAPKKIFYDNIVESPPFIKKTYLEIQEDIKLQIKDYIFNKTPQPKSQFSPEGRKELLNATMIKNLLSEGNFKDAMSSIINCLKNGVPEPINSQLKAYILYLLNQNNSEINSALAINILGVKFCKSCGQINKLTTNTCSNCGKFL